MESASTPADTLILVVTASHAGVVGFGDVFTCEVQEVRTGALEESRIRLTVLAGDREHLEFLRAHPDPRRIEVGFRLHRRNEPYGMAPVSGFVDQDRTSWTVEFMREAEEG